MINWLTAHAEYSALVLNTIIFMASVYNRDGPKMLYWGGAVLLVLGVIRMKG